MLTDETIRELCTACTHNEAGQHFTKWMADYEYLEELGLIAITRPVHDATGIPYSQEHWTLEVTDEGQALVDSRPDLYP